MTPEAILPRLVPPSEVTAAEAEKLVELSAKLKRLRARVTSYPNRSAKMAVHTLRQAFSSDPLSDESFAVLEKPKLDAESLEREHAVLRSAAKQAVRQCLRIEVQPLVASILPRLISKTALALVAKAPDRMKQLAKFAAATPFELPEIVRASRTLEVMTKGALSTGKGLELVGDIASGVNAPFEEIAMWVGRIYDGLKSGQPIGEAMMRMQELGVVTGGTRRKLEEMQETGASFNAMWATIGA